MTEGTHKSQGSSTATSSGKAIQETTLDPPQPDPNAPRAIRPAALGSVRISLTAEIGRVEMALKELREIRQGGVIPLDRGIGAPIDIRANGRLIARGEVVEAEHRRYGIRVTEVVAPESEEQGE